MTSWTTTLALLLWPMVAVWAYHTRPVGQATLWTILWAQLLLPEGAFIKLAPGIPQLDKVSLPSLAALFGCLLCSRRPLRFWNGIGLAEVFLLMLIIGPFITSELNGDLVLAGTRIIPSVGNYDALSAVVAQFLSLIPFFLARRVLSSEADHAEILRTLVIAGLIYSVPTLFEIKMSPLLNLWIYGYLPGGWNTAFRETGFRPVVFMENGLVLSFFMMTTVVAAGALWRQKIRVFRLSADAITGYLTIVLILCRSFGALIYGVVLLPLVRLTTPRLQLRIALVFVVVALGYPLLRTADIVPTQAILDMVRSVDTVRADSLQTRFDQENQLSQRALQRPMFGWGRYGRNRVYDAYGNDISITDGRWVITLGQFGLFGFLAEFGLLALPVFGAVGALKLAESRSDKAFLAALALILAANIVELLPNSDLTPWTWLLAGAILGRVEALHATSRPRLLRPRPSGWPRTSGSSGAVAR